jgi:hypothetical protein
MAKQKPKKIEQTPPWEEPALEAEETEVENPAPVGYVQEIEKLNSELTEVKLDLISLGPWSFSKYKSLKKCPFQFYLKYILKFKIPENVLTQSDPISANVGKAAHEILEHILEGVNIDEAYSKVRTDYLEKGLLPEEVWKERVDILHFNINKFKERIDSFKLRTPIKKVYTELKMGVTRDFRSTSFYSKEVWLRGVIDLVLVLECMDIVIIDHKTGGGQGSPNVYKEQLDWYKILFYFAIHKVLGAQTGIHFIGEGEVKMIDYTPAKDIETNLKNGLEMGLEGAIDMLKEKGYFKHIRGSYCKWCEYDNIGCKSGELKDLELSTKKWVQITPIT